MTERWRVVVTGIGAITPIGTTLGALWQGIRRERSAVGPLTRFDSSPFRSHNAAEVSDFVPTDHLEQKRLMDRERTRGAQPANGIALPSSRNPR